MATPKKDPKDHLPKGRPSKYTPEMCEKVIDCMKKGYIVEEVCAELGIHRDTFFEWVKSNPDFSDCYKKGKSAFIAFWARAYKKVMMGIPLNQPKKKTTKQTSKTKGKATEDENEKEEEAVELGKANPAMMIFYMKAHCNWRETSNVNNKHKFTDTIPESTKTRLEKIFEGSKKKAAQIKPKIITKKGTMKKGKNEG